MRPFDQISVMCKLVELYKCKQVEFFDLSSTTFGRTEVEIFSYRGLFAVGRDCSQPRTVGSPRTQLQTQPRTVGSPRTQLQTEVRLGQVRLGQVQASLPIAIRAHYPQLNNFDLDSIKCGRIRCNYIEFDVITSNLGRSSPHYPQLNNFDLDSIKCGRTEVEKFDLFALV